MKSIKKLQLLIALIIAITLFSVPTYANGYSILIQNNNSSISINNTEYSAYMLFESVPDNPGSYIYNPTTCLPVSYTPIGGSAISGTELLSWIADPARTTEELHNFSIYVYNVYINVTPAPTPSGSAAAHGQQATIALTIPGYYIVSGGGERADNHSPITALSSLTVTNPTSVINPKMDVPQVTKQVYHDNDDIFTSYSDHEIGDEIEYKITATVPSTTGYSDYSYIITDTLSEGLSFNHDLTMTVQTSATTINLPSSYYTVNALSYPENGFTLDINILEALNDGLIAAGDSMIASFTATLTEDAVINPDGTNDNTVVLEHSNDPQELVSVGNTPVSITQSLTFMVQLSKVNLTGAQLDGAEFVITLDEQLLTDSHGVPTNALNFIDSSTGTYTKAPSGYTGSTTTIITAGSVEISGLNSNTTYYLHEIKPPEGYVSTTAPTKFSLQAEYNNTTGELLPGYPTMLVGESTSPVSPVLEVVNYLGRELPDTGSSGGLIYVVFGFSMLALGVLVMYMLNKGSSDEK